VNKQLKAAWIEALRSGEYRQGKGKLQDEDTFCCLGVLCLAAEKIGLAKAARYGEEFEDVKGRLKGMYLGAQDELIARSVRRHEETLVFMNDRGTPFKKIADWIEQNIPGEP
jgi:hypothetical protein